MASVLRAARDRTAHARSVFATRRNVFVGVPVAMFLTYSNVAPHVWGFLPDKFLADHPEAPVLSDFNLSEPWFWVVVLALFCVALFEGSFRASHRSGEATILRLNELLKNSWAIRTTRPQDDDGVQALRADFDALVDETNEVIETAISPARSIVFDTEMRQSVPAADYRSAINANHNHLFGLVDRYRKLVADAIKELDD